MKPKAIEVVGASTFGALLGMLIMLLLNGNLWWLGTLVGSVTAAVLYGIYRRKHERARAHDEVGQNPIAR